MQRFIYTWIPIGGDPLLTKLHLLQLPLILYMTTYTIQMLIILTPIYSAWSLQHFKWFKSLYLIGWGKLC